MAHLVLSGMIHIAEDREDQVEAIVRLQKEFNFAAVLFVSPDNIRVVCTLDQLWAFFTEIGRGGMAEAIVIADLEAMVDRLDELEEYAADEGYRALETKSQEARGPLTSALGAMRQYVAGELDPR